MARVEIQDLGIKFNLDKKRDRTLQRLLLNPFRREKREEFWAIRNVSLTLRDGDVLGIVGPNGAGKSTLLRSITGIYQADEGFIHTEGRVSLLAIGAGFHPELTGIENIFLNGSVFGLRQPEIEALISNIAAFADIGEFIYQPIRMYSSGMVSRLGFAVAVNLDPDILLIDEVLAVGDKGFRKKCRAAIEQMIRSRDRIVVIVSHDQDVIDKLCTRTLKLEPRRKQPTLPGFMTDAGG